MKSHLASPRVLRWMRFIVGGGINTGFTYLLYLLINRVANYHTAYLIAYVAGIIFSYWFNAQFVFKVALSLRGLFAYPLVYLIQYLLSAFFLGISIEKLGIKETFAPLIVTILMIPLTYLMSMAVLQWKSRNQNSPLEDTLP